MAESILADRIFDGLRWHDHAAVVCVAGRIRAIVPGADAPQPQRRLPPGAFLTPGFIDLQVNGGGGLLLNDAPTAETMRAIAAVHRRFGTTACLPTLITDTRETLAVAIDATRGAAGRDGILGLHVEGPFINPARKGIHRADLIAQADATDVELLAGLAGAGRSLVTLAPECVPAGFVRALAGKGIRASAGHSEASAADMVQAADDGLTGVTHLFNAMPPLAAREPGIVGAALADKRLTAGLIVDGLHVDAVAIRAAFAAKGPQGIALVSDAMPSVGAEGDGFDLMGQRIMLADGKLTGEDGTLAGAHLTMAAAVRMAVWFAGVALEDALQSATLTPARFLGIAHERGRLIPGAHADMVALDARLDVIEVWVAGEAATA